MDRFRSDLPRLGALYDEFVSDDPQNFFHRFPQRLAPAKTPTLAYYKRIEDWLSYVPQDQWSTVRKKVKETISHYDQYRFWQQLHDVFSEALGFKLLTTKYRCSAVSFYRPADTQTPDLRGLCGSAVHYLEAKTVNHTQGERLSWYDLSKLEHAEHLPPTVERKLSDAYHEAMSQLSAPDDAPSATKIALLLFHVDHNIDPLDQSIESLVLKFLNSIEDSEFPIECHLFTS